MRSPGDALSEVLEKPRFRGVWHQYAFFFSLISGAALILNTTDARARVGAAIFAASLSAMFGASALYHRGNWQPKVRRSLRRLDHAAIYLLIAGTYTPFGLLVLSGGWQIAMLVVVWTGAIGAMFVKVAWIDGPTWVAPVIAVTLGWVGLLVMPQVLREVGVAGATLLLAGGALYTIGSVVYARRKPDPRPLVFGYHEIFHALVVVAAVCQYISVAFAVMPA